MTRLRPRDRQRGASLLQTVVALAIFAVLGSAAVVTTQRLQSYGNVSLLRAQLDGDAGGAAAFLMERLRFSGTEPQAGLRLLDPRSIDGTLRYHRVEFRVGLGLDATTGALLWSAPRAFGFAYAPAEAGPGRGQVALGGTVHGLLGGAPNGIDDDGDGLVDEGILYYEREDASGNLAYTILATNVLPESGFAFQSGAGATTPDPDGDALQLHIRVAMRDPTQRVSETIVAVPEAYLQSTVNAVATPRNRSNP